MYRNQIQNLVKWKNNKNKKPLIIRGARHVEVVRNTKIVVEKMLKTQ